MFRDMRRKRQMLSADRTEEILERGSSGVLAVMGEKGYPYAVPLNYIYHDSKIYFHCAKSGHKLDAIKKNGKVSFCVVDQDKVVSEEYTTYYRSAIIFGRARIMTDEKEIRKAIERLAKKYAPNETDERMTGVIDKEYTSLCMVEVSIDHITGKEAKELIES